MTPTYVAPDDVPVPRATFSESIENFSEPAPGPDRATWPTKEQLAGQLGVSEKTVEKYAREHQWRRATWRRPSGGRPVGIYHPDDVATFVAASQPRPSPFVLVADPGANGHGTAAIARTAAPGAEELLPAIVAALTTIAAALRTVPADPAPGIQKGIEKSSENSVPLFLTIPAAAVVSGFSQAYLRRKCQAGWSGAIKDGAWKIRRRDLEQL